METQTSSRTAKKSISHFSRHRDTAAAASRETQNKEPNAEPLLVFSSQQLECHKTQQQQQHNTHPTKKGAMTAMSKVPTTTIRESRIVDDKLNNDCFTDCSRYRKSRRKTMQTEAATSRWSGLVHSRSGSLKSCQNLLVILMLWLNLSSIECFQKPQEGESAMDFCAMRWERVSFPHSPVLLLLQTWMGNLKLALCVEKLPTTAQLQLSILNSIPLLSLSRPFSFSPCSFFQLHFSTSLGRFMVSIRYSLADTNWRVYNEQSRRLHRKRWRQIPHARVSTRCFDRFFSSFFLPFHPMPFCHFGNDSLSSSSFRLIYSEHVLCCVVLCSLAGVLSSFDDKDDTSRNSISCPWLTWATSTHTRYSIQFTFLIVVLFLYCCSIYWLILCNLSSLSLFLPSRKRCHRCVVIYEKHKNVLQYKESECDEVKEHLCPSALTSRSIIKTSEHDHTSDTRGVVANNTNHPNILAMKQGSSRVQSTSDHRSYDDNYSKQDRP